MDRAPSFSFPLPPRPPPPETHPGWPHSKADEDALLRTPGDLICPITHEVRPRGRTAHSEAFHGLFAPPIEFASGTCSFLSCRLPGCLHLLHASQITLRLNAV